MPIVDHVVWDSKDGALGGSYIFLQDNINGFSLVELMVVVAVIAVLANLSFSGYTDYRRKACHPMAKAQLKTISTGISANYPEGGYTGNCFSTLSCNTKLSGEGISSLSERLDIQIIVEGWCDPGPPPACFSWKGSIG